jgi:DNA-binding NarL/FixJ family response regulator
VLCWLSRGKSNAEIGMILGISAATVGKHLEHVYPKLGVGNVKRGRIYTFDMPSLNGRDLFQAAVENARHPDQFV